MKKVLFLILAVLYCVNAINVETALKILNTGFGHKKEQRIISYGIMDPMAWNSIHEHDSRISLIESYVQSVAEGEENPHFSGKWDEYLSFKNVILPQDSNSHGSFLETLNKEMKKNGDIKNIMARLTACYFGVELPGTFCSVVPSELPHVLDVPLNTTDFDPHGRVVTVRDIIGYFYKGKVVKPQFSLENEIKLEVKDILLMKLLYEVLDDDTAPGFYEDLFDIMRNNASSLKICFSEYDHTVVQRRPVKLLITYELVEDFFGTDVNIPAIRVILDDQEESDYEDDIASSAKNVYQC